jgi:hypothetical protein
MADIQNIYLQFLNAFPKGLQPIVSLVLAIFLIYSIIQVIRKNFIFLIALVVLLPASVPIIKGVGESAIMLIKFILNTK